MGRSLTAKEKELKEVVGTNVKRLRRSKGLSQAKLAMMIGKGREGYDNGGTGHYIRNIEKRGTLDCAVLASIADALGVSIIALFTSPIYSLRNMGDMLAQLAFVCKADVRKIKGGYAFCVYHRPMKEVGLASSGTEDDIATMCLLRYLEKLSWILPFEQHFSNDDFNKYSEKAGNMLRESAVIDFSDRSLDRHRENMKNSRLQESIWELPDKTGQKILESEIQKEKELDEIYKLDEMYK